MYIMSIMVVTIVSVDINFGYLDQESSMFSTRTQIGKPESTCAAWPAPFAPSWQMVCTRTKSLVLETIEGFQI